MKWLSRIIAFSLFIFFFTLALKNTQETVLYFFGGYELRGPLVLIVFCFFLGGCALGLLTMVSVAVRNRLELGRHRKKISELEHILDMERKANEKPDQVDDSTKTGLSSETGIK